MTKNKMTTEEQRLIQQISQRVTYSVRDARALYYACKQSKETKPLEFKWLLYEAGYLWGMFRIAKDLGYTVFGHSEAFQKRAVALGNTIAEWAICVEKCALDGMVGRRTNIEPTF